MGRRITDVTSAEFDALFNGFEHTAYRLEILQALYQHGKQVTVVMLEGALRARVVSAPTLAGQLDRLMAVSVPDTPREAKRSTRWEIRMPGHMSEPDRGTRPDN